MGSIGRSRAGGQVKFDFPITSTTRRRISFSDGKAGAVIVSILRALSAIISQRRNNRLRSGTTPGVVLTNDGR
jgi:hypothetical protein